jgi:hypothetical protein
MKKGGIAQLVERLLCKQDVSGSSPLISTRKKKEGEKTQHLKLEGNKKECWIKNPVSTLKTA